MPVNHWGKPAELPSLHLLIVEIDIGVPKHKFPCTRTTLEYGTLGRNGPEKSAGRVVNARGVIEEIGCDNIAPVEHRIIRGWGRDMNPPIFTPEQPSLFAIVGLIAQHPG